MGKTVFVVGAGASTEFGGAMPIGSALAESIELLAANESDDRSFRGPLSDAILQGIGMLLPQHRHAIMRIRQGIVTKESIDDFVEEWKDVDRLPEVAKTAIAHAILQGEASTEWGAVSRGVSDPSLALRRTRGSWLGQILRMHNRGSTRRDFATTMSDVAFVVFNYDRLIEYHLYHHMTIALGVPESEAREMLRTVPILHVYGPVGELPELGGWQRFGSVEPSTLFHSSMMIRTYSEAVDSLTGDAIANLVGDADKVIFLGAAYHRQNLKLLFPDRSILNAEGRPRVFGTTFGMRQPRIAEMEAWFYSAYGSIVSMQATAADFIDAHQDELFG